MATNVMKVVLLVVDHDKIGSDQVANVLADTHYPNHCIKPSVMSIESRAVEWSDSHPLNWYRTMRSTFDELFAVPPKLRPMSEAPTTGPVVEILAATNDRAGCRGWLIVHYADGGGEEQPRFRGWFYWTGFDFRQIETSKLLGWIPLPEVPK